MPSQSKSTPKPVTQPDAARIRSAEAAQNGGRTPAGGFGTRVDRAVQQREAGTRTSVGHDKP